MTDVAGAGTGGAEDARPLVVVLCTGNAARSVMGGALLADAPVRLVTAGTHVVEGQPMSRRTRAALDAVGVGPLSHRSRQLAVAEVEAATLVVAMAGEHVAYVRRRFPQAADRTATLKRLCRDLAAHRAPLEARVRALGLGAVDVEPWEDVADPAGGEDEDYVSCAKELRDLCAELLPRLADGPGHRPRAVGRSGAVDLA